MIRKPELVARFEDELARREPPDYRRNLAIFEALFCEARALGLLPGPDPLEGLEDDIRLARALNSRPRSASPCERFDEVARTLES
jgi:hypothetical protein